MIAAAALARLASLGEILEAMSRENVEIVRRYFDALNRGGSIALDAVRAFCDSGVEFHEFSADEGDQVYSGQEEVWRHLEEKYLEEFAEPPKEYRFDVEQLFDAEDEVVAVFYERHHGWVSGADIAMQVGWVFKFRHGKIVQVSVYEDREDALKSVGLLR
jgi:ketosteroid isomerase-like protein